MSTVCGLLALLISGCGGGGGVAAVATNSSNLPSSDAAPVAQSGSGATLAGCTKASYVPNYATIIPLYRWSGMPLKVHFQDSGLVAASDGSQVDLQQVALQGFAEWSDATSNGVKFVVTTDPAEANITVHFGTLAAAPTANNVLGLETSTLYSDDSIRSADILLNTWPGMTAANIDSFRETATHEFGHALGINGHSDSPTDVMYAAHSISTEKGLTTRDINTLRTGYCNDFSRAAPRSGSGPGPNRVTHND